MTNKVCSSLVIAIGFSEVQGNLFAIHDSRKMSNPFMRWDQLWSDFSFSLHICQSQNVNPISHFAAMMDGESVDSFR